MCRAHEGEGHYCDPGFATHGQSLAQCKQSGFSNITYTCMFATNMVCGRGMLCCEMGAYCYGSESGCYLYTSRGLSDGCCTPVQAWSPARGGRGAFDLLGPWSDLVALSHTQAATAAPVAFETHAAPT